MDFLLPIFAASAPTGINENAEMPIHTPEIMDATPADRLNELVV